jgi:hypothetical protein
MSNPLLRPIPRPSKRDSEPETKSSTVGRSHPERRGFSATGARIRAPGPPNPRTFDYQFDGATVGGPRRGGIPLRPAVSVFGDYKLSFATNDADLLGGGSLETDVWTNHVTFGVSYHFGARAGPGHALLGPAVGCGHVFLVLFSLRRSRRGLLNSSRL